MYTKKQGKEIVGNVSDEVQETGIKRKRTSLQNRSLHLFFNLLADELNLSGYDMKKVLKPSVDISWTKENVKEYLWRPIQEALKLKKSTTELTTKEMQEVWEILNRHLGEKLGVHVSFPSNEQTREYLNSLEQKQ